MTETTKILEARERILQALEADLVGPYRNSPTAEDPNASPPKELLPLAPSSWYLTGFLAPRGAQDPEDPEGDDTLGAGDDDDAEDTSSDSPEPKQKKRFPCSVGISVFLPGGEGEEELTATIHYADYVAEKYEGDLESSAKTLWRRFPRDIGPVLVPLTPDALTRGIELPSSDGLKLAGQLRPASAPGLPADTRALALFLINERDEAPKGKRDESFIFQVELNLHYPGGFVARPNRRGEGSKEADDQIVELQYRDHVEYAVGHGIAVRHVEGDAFDENGKVVRLATSWLPSYEVRRVKTHDEPGVELAMEALAKLSDGAAVRTALDRLPAAYAEWIEKQKKIPLDSDKREFTRKELLRDSDRTRKRIEEGIKLLASDGSALEAFRIANHAMALQARKRNPERYSDGQEPKWRLFQIAFFLLNLPALSDPQHADREVVELIFFPTGGGKTEAYLAVIAFALVLRRRSGQERPDRGLGVTVILRYTLRLLTLDQFGRAATLMCALEQLRQTDYPQLGTDRFTVGLWVGQSATDNTLSRAAEKISKYRSGRTKVLPSPLVSCPWCNEDLGADSLRLEPNQTSPERLLLGCKNWECDFAFAQNAEGLPVVYVDEQVYRELPAFLVATVDKFAMLPWRGETGMLFGKAEAKDGHRFLGPLDSSMSKKGAEPLPEGLLPPELIVQDELHLISGPLGTMVGLYETAIERLCARTIGDTTVLPKILASTATVRRAREQCRALFGRSQLAVFPPPGPDASETFFATVDRDSPGRTYVGVAAGGRAMKAILLRTYRALLSAGQAAVRDFGPEAADPYTSLVGYFNSLRELGGMRRLVEDQVRTGCATAEDRRPEGEKKPHLWAANREVHEPLELTSREPTAQINQTKDRLGLTYGDDRFVDVTLASNMISVGVDIDRLGLMVAAGPPTTTSEYIQATSRVGRQHPGLVVTCLNLFKPRDRSHYERFASYHESFYRFVEATSLTPFSGPALDRGLAGTLVSMVRLLDPKLTPPPAASDLEEHRAWAEELVERLIERTRDLPQSQQAQADELATKLRQRCRNLLDAWQRIADDLQVGAASLAYSPYDKDKTAGKPLLSTVIDPNPPDRDSDEAKFAAPTSMRDVEATAHLWLQRGRRLGVK